MGHINGTWLPLESHLQLLLVGLAALAGSFRLNIYPGSGGHGETAMVITSALLLS